MQKLKAFAHGALVPVLLLILWEAGSRFGLFSEVLLPSPTAVAIKWWAYLLPAQPQEAGQSTLQRGHHPVFGFERYERI